MIIYSYNPQIFLGKMMQSQQHFRTVVPRVRGRDDGCCGISFLKAALYVFNCFFWVRKRNISFAITSGSSNKGYM